MDRIEKNIILKKIIFLFIQVFVFFDLNCIENVSYPLLLSEVNYDYEKMLDAEKDTPIDKTSYEYSLNILRKEKNFLNSLRHINENPALTGEWKLTNKDGKQVVRHSYYFNNEIFIQSYNKELVLDNWGNRSLLYEGEDSRYYILSRGINIIRMIKIEGTKLFVYIVKDGQWLLDPIHEDGKYYFVKTDTDSVEQNPNLKEWFQKL